MAKAAPSGKRIDVSAKSGAYVGTLTDPAVRHKIIEIKKASTTVEGARKFLRDAGLTDPSGKLKKRFGG